MSDVRTLVNYIDDVTLESELSVLNSLAKVYAKQADMISRCEDLESLEACFTEADAPAVDPANQGNPPAAKPSLIRRMFNAIKKFFALIGRCFKVILQALGNIFRKPGQKKSMGQILEECGFKPNGANIERNTAWGDYLLEFRSNDQFVIKYQKYLREKNGLKDADLKVPIYKGSPASETRAINLLTNEQYRTALFSFIRQFIAFLKNTISTGNFDENAWKAIKEADYKDLSEDKGYDEQAISYRHLVAVQGELNKLQAEFDTINYEQYDALLAKLPSDQRSKFESVVGSRIGKLTEDLNRIHMSFNELANLVVHAFDLPQKYYGTVKTPEELDTFVKKCVEGGIPPRFVMHGIAKICADELRGPKTAAGQSRMVLFPTKDNSIVYKVAYNGFGVSSNKAEIAVFNFIKSHNSPDKLVAPIVNVYGDGYVIAMERAGTKQPSYDQLNELHRKFQQFATRNHWNINMKDLHEDNVRQMSDGEWVAIDYGWAPRG